MSRSYPTVVGRSSLPVCWLFTIGGHKKIDEGVRVLLKYGAPTGREYLEMYRDLAKRILGRNKKQEVETDQSSVVADLRAVLYGARCRMTGKEVRRNLTLRWFEQKHTFLTLDIGWEMVC